MSEKISKKIKIVNFIMTLSIVLYHCYAWYSKVPVYQTFDKSVLNIFNYIANSMGTIATGVFFLISGFLLYYNCNNSKEMKTKIKKRVKSIIIPFFIWNVFTFIYLFFRDGLVFPFEDMKDLIMHFTLDPYNIPIWYMFALILLLIPDSLIIKLKGRKRLSLLIYIAMCTFTVCYCNLNCFKGIRIFEIERIIKYIPLYFLGVFAGMNYSDFVLDEKWCSRKISIISIIFLIVCALIRYSISNKILEEIIITLESIFVWFAIPCLLIKETKISSFFKYSFMIYVLHCPMILDLIDKMITPLMLSGKTFYSFQIIIVDLIIVFLTCFISILITVILKNILNKKLFDLITGSRL